MPAVPSLPVIGTRIASVSCGEAVDAIMDAGKPFGIKPFGLEAQSVLRLEKAREGTVTLNGLDVLSLRVLGALLEKQIAEAPRDLSPTVSGTGQTVVDGSAMPPYIVAFTANVTGV